MSNLHVANVVEFLGYQPDAAQGCAYRPAGQSMTPIEVWKNENIYQGNRILGQKETWKFNYLHCNVKYFHTCSFFGNF